MKDISPEILNYVLKERQNQDSNNSTTEAGISEDLAGDIIIEGEFLESGEDSCSTEEDAVSYDIKDVKSYSMNSGGEIGNSATIMFQEVTIEEESRVNFGKKSILAGEMVKNCSPVCNFSSSRSSLLSDSGCLPEIYLVSGHNSCSDLPQTVTAKKLAEIHQTGAGQTLVDLSWSELTNTCVIIVK